MTRIYGNQGSQDRTRFLLRTESRARVIVLAGPSHVGKASFASEFFLEQLEETDFSVVDHGVAGARNAVSFLSSEPSFSPYRAVLVDGAESLSEPAQDAYLKLCEEPPGDSRIVFVTADEYSMLPALRSRIQEVVRWSALSDVDVSSYVASLEGVRDPDAESMCRGRPGLYAAMSGDAGFRELSQSVLSLVSGPASFDLPVPSVIKSLENKASPRRTAVAEVCRASVAGLVGDPSKRRKCAAVLRFSAVLLRHPSANAEVHWQRTSVSCSL